jgi:hypothetical protein
MIIFYKNFLKSVVYRTEAGAGAGIRIFGSGSGS